MSAKRRIRALTVLVVVTTCLYSLAPTAHAGLDAAGISAKVVRELEFEIGTEVEFVVQMEQAVRLTCSNNRYGLERVILHPSSDTMHLLCFWSGERFSGSTRDLEILSFSQRYRPASQVNFHVRWQMQGQAVKVILLAKMEPARSSRFTSADDIIGYLRARVTSEVAYELGAEIQLSIPMDRAARLICEQNPYGLEEILLGPTEGLLYHYCFYSGQRSAGGSRRLDELEFFNTQTHAPQIGFSQRWRTENGKVVLTYRVMTDEEEVARRVAERLSERLRRANTISLDERLAGFAQLWSEVKYNFAFFDQVPDLDWDEVLLEYLPKVQKEQTAYEYYRLLQRLVVRLHDGHTSVRGGVPPGPVDRPPVLIRPIDGKAVIVDFADTEELSKAGIRRGLEVTHADGRPFGEVLEKDIYPYISASTPQDRDRKAFRRLLEGPRGSQVSVRAVTGDGGTREVALTRRSVGVELPWTQRALLEYRDLSDGIAYVALNSFGSEKIVKEFDGIFESIREAKGLILDVRVNGGGSSSIGYAIIGRLTDRPLETSHWRTRQYMPAFRAWGKEEEWYEGSHGPVQPRGDEQFLGPVVVLIGPGTVSAAEDFLIPLHPSGRATLVGERTAGTTGQPLIVRLPKGGQARICTKRDTYPDGREFVGVGVIPDVEAHPTQADVAAGRDTILQTGIEVLRALIKERGSQDSGKRSGR